MSALPRPDLPPGPRRDLNEALHELHHHAGWPSLRTLAARAGCSHTTVSTAFSSPKLPSWGTLELLVEAMGGDTSHFQQLWLAASTPEDSPATHTPRIAGRRDELATVRHHLETGTGLLLVTGEAGIGKTTLVGAAAALTPETTFVATGACLPLSSEVPLLPVADALRFVYDSDNGGWLRGTLADCVPYVGESLALLVPELATSASARGIVDEWARQRLFAAVATAMRSLDTRRHLGLLIEDLHWADSATLDLLEHLSTRPSVPIVGTWRVDDPGLRATNVAWSTRMRRSSAITTLELGPLDRDGTAAQLADLAGAPATDSVVSAIYRRARGQPLFTEQLAAHGSDSSELPSLLVDLLDERLVGLSEAAWFVARSLGVADRPIDGSLVADMANLSVDEAEAGLHDLDSRRLLAPIRGRDVSLRHPLLAEAVRRRLVPSEAAAAHARAAAVLAAFAEPEPAEIAQHWAEADEPVHELDWRVRAAIEARKRFASAQEADQWLRVIELCSTTPSETTGSVTLVGAHVAAMEALNLSSQQERATDLARRAVMTLGDAAGGERADLLTVAGALIGTSAPEPALALIDEAIRIHEANPPDRCLALCLKDRSDILRALGRYDEGAEAVARSVRIMRDEGDPVRLRLLLVDQAWYQLVAGDVKAAFRALPNDGPQQSEDAGPHRDIRFGCQHTDMLLLAGAAAEDVEAAADRGLASAASWEIRTHNAGYLRANVSRALSRAGRVREAWEIIGPETGAFRADHWMLFAERARLNMCDGELGAAADLFDRLSRVPIVNFRREGELAEAASECYLWLRRPDRASERVTWFLDGALGRPAVPFVGGTFVMAARAAADMADDQAAGPATRHHLLDEVLALRTRTIVDPFGAHRVPADRPAWGATWSAELTRLGDDQTVQPWAVAASAWDKLTRPHDAAYCRWRGAQAALRHGQGTVAAKLLKRAAREAREHVPLTDAIRETAGGV